MNTKYLGVKDIMDILSISRNTAYKLFKHPMFPKIQIGNRYRVEENAFKEFLDTYNRGKIIV